MNLNEKSNSKPFENNSINNYKPPIFWNFPLDKGRLKSFIVYFLRTYGEKKTIELLEQLKDLGFGYATKAGISLGIEDLKIPPTKRKLIGQSELHLFNSVISYRKGDITGIEKMQNFIETWHETSNNLKQEVVQHFEKTDILNPVYMMAFSGARGNLSQVRQLVGMRGLMSDPQGKIIDFPIQSNFREGLTLTEYLISTYGARKGIVDTALRTATAGYLTRRLVDVAQHVIVSKFDCGTNRGIFLFDMKDGSKTIYSFQNRLTGRVLAQDVFMSSSNLKEDPSLFPLNNAIKKSNLRLASRNQEVSAELALAISKVTKKALVRSALTCETRKFVCQLCYGWSLATSRLVSIGEAVGVIAGQSIGEPGTQLTMRTFHTGGVFSGGVTDQIKAPFKGIIEYADPISGTCIRTPQGMLAFLTKTNGTLFLKKMDSELDLNILTNSQKQIEFKNSVQIQTYKIPPFTLLFARQGQVIDKDKLLAQISAFPIGQKLTQTIEQTIYSDLEGEVYYSQIELLEDIDEKYGERISKAEDWSKVWVLSGKIYQDILSSNFLPKRGDFVSKNSILNQIEWITPISQFSYIDLPSCYSKNGLNNDYSYEFMLQNAFSLIPRNPKSKLNPLRPQTNLTKSIKSPSLNDKQSLTNLKPTMQIVPKYNIKKNWLFNFVNVKTNKNSSLLFKNQKTANFYPLKEIKTKFFYPYQPILRPQMIKTLSQTFISLPILRPGVLMNWLNSDSLKTVKKENIKSFDLIKQKNQTRLVKKLNLNKKFRIYNLTKKNYFHPLVLQNFIYFSLKARTLQTFLNRKRVFSSFLIEKSSLYPYFSDPLMKVQEKSGMNSIQNGNSKSHFFMFTKQVVAKQVVAKQVAKYEQLKYEQLKYEQLKYEQLKHEQYKKVNEKKMLFFPLSLQSTLNVKNQTITIKKEQNISVLRDSEKKKYAYSTLNSFKNQKLEPLSLKTPILALNAENICYKKLGYFISIESSYTEKDRFFSFFPLRDARIDAHKSLLLKDSSDINLFGNLKKGEISSMKNNPMNLLGLNNTNQWSPNSLTGFVWFPSLYQSLTSGAFLISSPRLFQKYLKQKLSQNKKRNLKTTLALTKSYMHFLNMAQSMIKKHEIKKANFPNSSKQKSSNGLTHSQKPLFSQFQLFLTNKQVPLKNPQFNVIIKNSKKNRLKSVSKHINQNAYEKNIKLLSLDKDSLLNISLKCNPFNEFEQKCSLIHLIENQKLNKKENKIDKKNTKNNLILKYIYCNKNFVQLSNFNKSKDLLKSIEIKKKLDIQKKLYKAKEFKNLVLKFNFSKKYSVSFFEIDWLPQENYVFKSRFNSNTWNLLEQNQFYFVSNKKRGKSTDNQLSNISLINAQGLKKAFGFRNDGLVKVKNLNSLKSIPFSSNKDKIKKNLTITKTFDFFFKSNFSLTSNRLKHVPQTIKEQMTKSKFPIFKNVLMNPLLNTTFKLQFLNYIQTKKPLKKNLLNQIKGLKNPNLKSNFKWAVQSSQYSDFFCCIPFINAKQIKKPSKKYTKLSKKFCLNSSVALLKNLNKHTNIQKISKVQTQSVHMNLKSGWIYKTNKFSNILNFKKICVDPGKNLLDDISFEQQKIFIEIIPITKQIVNHEQFQNKIQRSVSFHDSNIATLFHNFKISSSIKNSQLRFFNISTISTMNSQDIGDLLNETTFSFFICPLRHMILPTAQQMKINLYKKMQKEKTLQLKQSYFFYKQYLANELNQQKISLKTISNFPPIDLQLTTESFSLLSQALIPSDKKNYLHKKNREFTKKSTKSKLKQRRFREEKQKKQIKSALNLPKFLCNFYGKRNTKNRSLRKLQNPQILQFFKNYQTCKNLNFLERNMYFSNYPMNFLKSTVSLKIPPNLLSHSFSQICLNKTQANLIVIKPFSGRFNHQLKTHYLSILFNKTLNNVSFISNMSLVKQKKKVLNLPFNSIVEKQKHNLTDDKQLSLSIFCNLFKSMPFFEYSLHQKYAFLSNQRLFASSFYKHQFENFLKVKVLNGDMLINENFNGKKFVKKIITKNTFSESFMDTSVSKNHIIFKNQNLKNTIPFGLTSFYSPFEGEILKIYSQVNDLQPLKKGVSSVVPRKGLNLHLEKAFIFEQELQKLFLTKADLLSLRLPIINTSVQKSDNFLPPLFGRKLEFFEKFSLNETPHLTSPISFFFSKESTKVSLESLLIFHQTFQKLEENYYKNLDLKQYSISDFKTMYKKKRYKIKTLNFSLVPKTRKLRLGTFLSPGDPLYSNLTLLNSGQIIHLNSKKLTLRKAQFFSISPQAILHTYNGHYLTKNSPVMTLPFQTLKTGDIVQGIPKVEQYLEARTTIRGRLFLNSLPVLLHAIYKRYSVNLNMEKAVRQSFLKIQQILVDGVQRVYRSQGVSIADKHLEIIVRQMTSKVKIIHGGQTGFFAGELVDLEFVERVNQFLMVKIRYEPVVLGITRSSLEVDSFLSAASFQQTTKVLTRAAIENKRDFLKGLKENLLVGNLLPAGTGYIIPVSQPPC